MRRTLSALILLSSTGAMAQPVERYYIANDDHTDYLWAADVDTYTQAFQRMLDFYMDQAERTAGNPVDSRGRFNADGSFWLWEYEHNRTPAEFQRLIGHVRAGNISVPFQSLVLLDGAMPTEAVLRDMYYAGGLERRFGLDLELAVMMENQVMPLGLASLWAGAGAKYSWRGVCACASRVSTDALIDRPREIYHYTGLDGSSVVLKWNSLDWDNQRLGGYAEARRPHQVVEFMQEDAAWRRRWPFAVYGAFGYGWDDVETQTDEFIVAAQALSGPNRRVIVSNEVDFFEDFVEAHGDDIPHFSGAMGNEWDLYAASLAAVSAAHRRTMERLRTAEAAAALVLLVDPRAIAPREAQRERAHLDMGLYYEHNWVANGVVSREGRADWQRQIQRNVARYVDTLQADALAALGRMVPGGPGRHIVFNGLGFTRTGPVDLPDPGAGVFHVIDVTTGEEVPSQRVGAALRIRAADVPPVGYRVYEVRPGAGRNFGPSARADGATLDNGVFAVRLRADGAIDSAVAHTHGDRELVGAGRAWNVRANAGQGQVRAVDVGAVQATLEVEAPGAPRHRTRVTLYRGLDRIEVDNDILQNFGDDIGFQYDFAVRNQVLRHEEVGAILRVARHAEGGDYADELTRTDYLTLNHFLDLSEGAFGVTLSSRDVQFFRAGNSDVDTLDSDTPSVFLPAGMQVDRPLGINDQGGETRFDADFALQPHGAWDAAEAMRFALDHQNPLVSVAAAGPAGAPLPGTSFALLAVDTPNAVLWALKPAEAGIGEGLALRLWNLAEDMAPVSLRPRWQALAEAWRASHVEIDLGPADIVDGAMEDLLPRQALRTYRVTLQAGGEPPPPPPDAGLPPPLPDVSFLPADAGPGPSPDAAVEPPRGDSGVAPPPADAGIGPATDAAPAEDLDATVPDGGAPPPPFPDTGAPPPDAAVSADDTAPLPDAPVSAGDAAPPEADAGENPPRPDAGTPDLADARGPAPRAEMGPVGDLGAEPTEASGDGGAGGCGCRSVASGGPPAWLLLTLPAFARRRRVTRGKRPPAPPAR